MLLNISARTSKIHKRQNGRYYTEGNPFMLAPFQKWAGKIDLKNKIILEPFAGANHIIRLLKRENYAQKFISYDIYPMNDAVFKKDTLSDFPQGFEAVVTNPPWLAKNSAKRRGLNFPNTDFDDLYKYALNICLENCNDVAAIIPATFLQSRLFRNRLDTFIVLHDKNLFSDTDNPSALALFNHHSENIKIYYDDKFIGTIDDLEKYIPETENKNKIRFNDKNGELGFIAFDNTAEPTIRFCRGADLSKYEIKHTTRMITRIAVDKKISDKNILKLNFEINRFREQTRDVFLTPFKGLRKDGMYRRRMDYALARKFISEYA